jgi:uncharacterized repeat protein (TIGR01451 family)
VARPKAIADALPAPWLDTDIGAPAAAGSAAWATGTFTVSGSGVDIWTTADSFHFVYQPLTGDGTIIAHVVSQDDTNEWAKAGVMIRNTLDADSPYADMVVTPAQGLAFQYRSDVGVDAIHVPGDLVAAPYWVKLVRTGDDFAGYVSEDGVTWTLVGETTIAMNVDLFIGLPVCSHDDGVLSTAVFDNVSVTGGADLAMDAQVAPSTVIPGGELTYTLTVTNAGPIDATSVSVTNHLPAGATLENASGTGWDCSAADPVVCTMDSLPVGTAEPITITALAPGTEGTAVDDASVSSATSDADPSDNDQEAIATVANSADLSIGQSALPDTVCGGAPVTFTINVSNAGPTGATSVSVSDTIPSGSTLVSATGSGWDCTGTSTITCTRPSLAMGAAPAITVTVDTPLASGLATNTASVSATTADPAANNNSSNASATVNAIPSTPAPSNNGPICAGATLQLSTDAVAGATYAWTGPNGFVSNAQNPAIPSASASASGLYGVTVTVAGCTSSAGTTQATVNPLPSATVSGSAAICPGGATQIEAALTGTSPWSLQWSDGVAQSGVVSSPATRLVSPASTTIYTVTSVTDAHCTTVGAGSATVTLNSVPTAVVSGDATICQGASTQIQAVLTGTGPWTLQWSDGVKQSGVNTSPAVRTVSPTSTLVYTVTSVADALCSASGTGSATVTVGDPITAPDLTAPRSLAVNTEGATATVPLHAGSTYAWTLTGGAITGGQGTNQITFDAGTPGTTMHVSVTESNTSCTSPASEAKIQVDFLDVPPSNQYHDDVDTIALNGITVGCQDGTFFCPDDPNTRAEMAVFLIKAKFGADHVPPPATGTVFQDVPIDYWAAAWIEELASLGITSGCDATHYCPDAPVSRAQMAVLLLKMLMGADYVPPTCVGLFGDVPCTPGVGFPDWIEDLYNRHITAGCSSDPLLYCPDAPNTRSQMAVFLTLTFSLP